jgi:N-acetylglucosaminyldiphosphoundecaprenol N-acetyl-beta-D-mannosaminyltransferase
MPDGTLAGKVTLFGIPIANLTLAETVDHVEELIRSGRPHQHVVVNVDKVVKMQRDPQLRAAVLSCELINCEGQPIVWASRLLGWPLKARVTGVDLFQALAARCAARGFRVFLLGAREEVVRRVAEVLQARHPTLVIAGWRDGYWEDAAEPGVLAAVRAARPDVLFMATPSPKKELFLGKWKQELAVPFVMGVGGSFDVVAGKVRRAPVWVQRCGMEWFYRFAQEPRRMWHRYFVEDLAFFPLLWREWRMRKGAGRA